MLMLSMLACWNTVNGQKTDSAIDCQLLKMAHLVYFISPENDINTDDTITILDVRDISYCLTRNNYEFGYKEFDVFKKIAHCREAYFDLEKKDSIIAWLEADLYMCKAKLIYGAILPKPEDLQIYGTVEYNNRRHIFKVFTSLDITDVVLQDSLDHQISFKKCF